MYYYITIAFILYLLGIIEINENRKTVSKAIAIISAIVLILFAGLKIDGATDFISYKLLFNQITIFNKEGLMEPGFQLWMVFFHHLLLGFTIFYFFTVAFSVSAKTAIIYKLAPFVSVALMIYFSGCFFERDNDGIRQGISIAFCFIALYFLIKDNYIFYILFTLIAISFHYSSVIFFGAFILKKLHWKNKTILLLICLSYIINIAGIFITKFLLPYVPTGAINDKIDMYASKDYGTEIGITVGLLFRTFILFLFMKYRNILKIEGNLFYILRNGLAFSIICSLCFGDFIIISHRLPYVFREFQIFIISFLIAALPNKGYRILGLTITFAYTCIILSRFFIEGSIYNNYKNILF